MSNSYNDQIIKIRKLLQNPYAYMDDMVYIDAKVETLTRQLDMNKIMGNPYASLNTVRCTDALPRNKKLLNNQLIPNLRAMENPYAYLNGNSVALSKYALMGNPYASVDGDENVEINVHSKQSISHIEKIARELQSKIWKNRHKLWPKGVPINPVDLLEPSIAFNSIDYDYEIYETLDDYSNGQDFKIAGLINQTDKKAYISNQFSLEVQRFTSAHELGHALMHRGTGLHRDRALDGAPVKGKKDKEETEADKFAAYFLMPSNLVIKRFKQIFGTEVFALNDATIFALDPANKMSLMGRRNNLRTITRILAETNHYNGQHINSLSKQFRVSVETMAIRLEELKLILI